MPPADNWDTSMLNISVRGRHWPEFAYRCAATFGEFLWPEVFIVNLLGHFLKVLHVCADHSDHSHSQYNRLHPQYTSPADNILVLYMYVTISIRCIITRDFVDI